MPKLLYLAVSFGLFILPTEVYTKEVRLHHEDGSPVLDYRDQLASLEPGDTVISANERIPLGKGEIIRGTDVIAHLRDGSAVIRLNGFYPPQGDDAVTQIIEGRQLLDGAGIRHNEVDEARSRRARYVIHQYYPNMDLLPDYLARRAQGQADPHMDRALIEFAATTSPFYFIGDFGIDQIGFDGTGWRLMDWTNEHYLIEHRNQRHTWDRRDFEGNDDLYQALDKRIREVRATFPSPYSCLIAGART